MPANGAACDSIRLTLLSRVKPPHTGKNYKPQARLVKTSAEDLPCRRALHLMVLQVLPLAARTATGAVSGRLGAPLPTHHKDSHKRTCLPSLHNHENESFASFIEFHNHDLLAPSHRSTGQPMRLPASH